ncbi:MAG: sigma 54-interacting transcriptional regulator [Desulfobacterales bacterium]|nr:sigma 54-interacting transcriptional regulator [Desulfobacterales bacterium]
MKGGIREIAPSGVMSVKSVLSILDHYHQAVVISNLEGCVVYYNRAAAHMDDMKREDVLGRKVTELYRVDEGVSPTMKSLKSGQPELNLACYYRTHLGRMVNSICNVFPIFDENRHMGAVCFMWEYQNVRDYTEMASQSARMVNLQNISPRVVKEKSLCFENGTRYTFDSIIGEDSLFKKTVASARLASRSPSSTILAGETGTGKELFAQAIHNNGPRHKEPFVAINCAAIPEHLLEGILFGTSKGAFTGAVDKAGIFEQANGGTLLLDEVNSMAIGLQAKLLRTLQERCVRRVGSLRELPIDLKIISTVNEDLNRACEQGFFRKDLMYRLGAVYLEIPPLRKRPLDVGLLTHHFIHRLNRTLGMNVAGVSQKVMAMFESSSWPGNVRELEHTIEGAMNMMHGDVIIDTHHLVGVRWHDDGAFTEPGVLEAVEEDQLSVIPPTFQAEALDWSEVKRVQESDAIRDALEKTRGNAAKAATILGISPQLIHYRIKKYGICRKAFKEKAG